MRDALRACQWEIAATVRLSEKVTVHVQCDHNYTVCDTRLTWRKSIDSFTDFSQTHARRMDHGYILLRVLP